MGPVETRLASFPRVHGLAFGGLGEASGAVHALQTVVCRGIAARWWRSMGARSQAEALGFVTSAGRRRWGIAAVRAQAECRLGRLQYVGLPRGGGAHADGAPAAEADAAAACGGGAFDARFASGDGGWAGAPRFG